MADRDDWLPKDLEERAKWEGQEAERKAREELLDACRTEPATVYDLMQLERKVEELEQSIKGVDRFTTAIDRELEGQAEKLMRLQSDVGVAKIKVEMKEGLDKAPRAERSLRDRWFAFCVALGGFLSLTLVILGAMGVLG